MLHLLSPGMLATVEDLGRPAARRFGVPGGGAMDSFALAAANRLVGNPPGAAALELTGGGARFVFQGLTLFALTGADFAAQLDEVPLRPWTAVLARAGQELRLSGRRGGWGARAYLALAGGVDVPVVLGSCSTCLAGGFGGYHGRVLWAGDTLPTGPTVGDGTRYAGVTWPTQRRPAYQVEPTLRVLPGPHGHHLSNAVLKQLCHAPFQVSATSNRMGYRLEGTRLAVKPGVSLPSLGVLPGVIQLPPDGAPILLMADAQTTGGYPIVGMVISADLPLAAQLLPGDRLRFAVTNQNEARESFMQLQHWLDAGPDDDDDDVLLPGWAGYW
ncbi:MAG: biotin-dependent carboxyltransferase family protein [Chloroflexaceae bacterium]|jgi:biotin-dependent carboxylase-like uncharacterized protein|nr:biotin-dependent carboxyltransferase family protein [Chloroflexaceae bacterium]